jgi:hypothetical protein
VAAFGLFASQLSGAEAGVSLRIAVQGDEVVVSDRDL